MKNKLHSPRLHKGFTLAELLIASAIGVLLITATTSLAVSENLSNHRIRQLQRLRSNWAKLTHLINIEVAEGSNNNVSAAILTSGITTANSGTADAGATTTACANPGASSLFTINVKPISTTTGISQNRLIHYYLQTTSGVTSLRRCGPAITSSGTLATNSTTTVDSMVMRGINLNATINGAASGSGGSTLTITPTALSTALANETRSQIGGVVSAFSVETKSNLIQ
ncbi:MAG: type II secretion system protein J [Cyanobacteriota bacterium]